MLDILKTRRSVRRWTAEPIPEQDLHHLLEAAVNAPSAGNEQAWQFVVLQGSHLARYVEVNRNTPRGAPLGILICGDRSAEKYDGYAIQDCCAAIENLLIAAHALGYGAVWTAVFPQNLAFIREHCALPEHVFPVAFIPVGRPAAPVKAVSRFDAAKVHRDRW